MKSSLWSLFELNPKYPKNEHLHKHDTLTKSGKIHGLVVSPSFTSDSLLHTRNVLIMKQRSGCIHYVQIRLVLKPSTSAELSCDNKAC